NGPPLLGCGTSRIFNQRTIQWIARLQMSNKRFASPTGGIQVPQMGEAILQKFRTKWDEYRLQFNRDKSHHLHEKLGTRYGGWYVPSDLLNAQSICYCIGAGEDISFDIELINRFDCHVYTFDPTPRAQ